MLGRPTAVHYGIIAGLAAVGVEVFFRVNTPPAYGICMPCHGQDALNWTVNHVAGTHFQVAPISQFAPVLTPIGVVIGAAIAAARNGELRWTRLGNPLTSMFLGMAIVMCALTTLGCTTRLWLRVAYGDPLALFAVAGVMVGIAGGTGIIRWQASRA